MRLHLVLILVACLNVQAQETLTTTEGRAYSGITSIKPAGNAVRIIHADGAATVPYSSIPESERVKFGYDPAKAAAADSAQRAAAEASAKQSAAAASKVSKVEKKKAAAVAHLKSIRFGGPSYWSATRNERLDRKRFARNSLMQAGYTEAAANSILEQMIRAGQSDPRPPQKPLDPVFTQPQGALRGVPDGTTKNPSSSYHPGTPLNNKGSVSKQ